MGIMKDINNQLTQYDVENIIQALIDDEVEAITGYERAMSQVKSMLIAKEGYEKAIDTFKHIIDEEKEHIVELKELLK